MVTHDYKLIFIHIPKCGGRSIANVFNQRFDHFTAHYYHKEYDCYWDHYDVFSIVRNPYARLCSIYHFLQQLRKVKPMPILLDWMPFKQWVKHNLFHHKGYFDINSAEANWAYDWQIGSPFWFSPQVRFVGDGKFCDKIKIFRMEDGLDKVEDFFRSKGVPHPKIDFINESRHKHWPEYYDDDLYDFLRKQDFIKQDCEAFGYELK